MNLLSKKSELLKYSEQTYYRKKYVYFVKIGQVIFFVRIKADFIMMNFII
jgi:hypothetical protein